MDTRKPGKPPSNGGPQKRPGRTTAPPRTQSVPPSHSAEAVRPSQRGIWITAAIAAISVARGAGFCAANSF